MLTLILPWPPSVNSYWRTIIVKGGTRTLLSMRARQYQRAAIFSVRQQRPAGIKPLKGRLALTIELHPPTLRRYDIDNFNKAIMDGMEYAKVYVDDEQVDELYCYKRPKTPLGKVVVTLTEL